MITVLIQTGLCLLAGLAMWKMWRVVEREDRLVRWVVFIGFTARAVIGTILFWVSYLRLPIFSRLQMGNGHWFFASDGESYLREAISIAHGGLPTILTHHRTGASVSYVQTLATFTMLFGNAASVGVLVNLFSYLGMCLIVIKWRHAIAAERTAGMIALAAISLSPSAILWSTQPLKDTLFQFLMVCLVGAGALWQRAWRARPAAGAVVAAALIMIATLFLASGIRWYFGFIALAACGLFFLLTAMTTPGRWRAAAAGAVTFFLLTQALVISASAYLPPYLQKVLAPWKQNNATIDSLSPTRLAEDLKAARQGFENTGGATSIGVSGPLARIDEGRRIVPAAAPVTDEDFKRIAAARSAAVAVTATPVIPEVKPRSKPGRRKAAPADSEPQPVTTVAETDEVPSTETVAETSTQSAEATPSPVQPVETRPEKPAAPASSPAPSQPVKTAAAQPAPSQPVQTPAPVPAAATTKPAAPVAVPAPAPSRPAPSVAHAAAPVVPAEAEADTPLDQPAPSPAAVPQDPGGLEDRRSTSAAPETEPTAQQQSAADAGTRKTAAPVRKPRRVQPKRRAARPAEAVTTPPKQVAVAPAPTPAPTPVPVPTTPKVTATPAAPTNAAPKTASPSESGGMGDGEIVMPTSTAGRLVAGAVAVLLPSHVARALGLLEMGGGRGFWWFTDVDTFVFDTLLVIAIVFVFRAVRRTRWETLRNPVFWLLLLMASVVIPIAYTITNYGTLFRLRAMLYLTLALIPLAVSKIGAADDEVRVEAEPPATGN
jgi:hypothetical protein